MKKKFQNLPSLNNLIASLKSRLHPDAPVLVSKGNVIADGFSEQLDSLRSLKNKSQSHLNDMLERETDRTQIPSLKIAFNNVFGYYIEVRNTHKDKVPNEWVRKLVAKQGNTNPPKSKQTAVPISEPILESR